MLRSVQKCEACSYRILLLSIGCGNIRMELAGPAVIVITPPKEMRLRSHTPFHLLKVTKFVILPQKPGDKT